MKRYILITVFILSCVCFISNKSSACPPPLEVAIEEYYYYTPINTPKSVTAEIISGGPVDHWHWYGWRGLDINPTYDPSTGDSTVQASSGTPGRYMIYARADKGSQSDGDSAYVYVVDGSVYCDSSYTYGPGMSFEYSILPTEFTYSYAVFYIEENDEPIYAQYLTGHSGTIYWPPSGPYLPPGNYTAYIEVGFPGGGYFETSDDFTVDDIDVDITAEEDYIAYETGMNFTYDINPDTGWDPAFAIFEIQDSSESTVYGIDLGSSIDFEDTIEWDGEGNYGSYNDSPLPAGYYTAYLTIEIPGPWGNIEITDYDLFTVVDVEMELVLVGGVEGIEIDPSNNYSENATVKVTAVNSANGQTCTWFTGDVSIAEDAINPDYEIYTQNGGYLPSSITFSTGDYGVKTFIAKSLAGPKGEDLDYADPDPAKIMTTNYEVYNAAGYLIIEQWVDVVDFGGKGTGYDITDWFEKRTEDIFDNAPHQDINDTVNDYEQFTHDEWLGYVNYAHATKSKMYLNANDNYVRINTEPPGIHCVYYKADHLHKNLVLHESRHCYQNYLSSVDLGQREDDPDPESWDDPDNDDDQDWLVDYVPIAPTEFLLDTTTLRQSCAGNNISFSGDNYYDSGHHLDYSNNNVAEPDAGKYACDND